MDKKLSLTDLMEQAFLLGLGVASYTKEAVEKTANDLVERGRVSRDDARKVVDSMRERGSGERAAIRDAVRDEVQAKMERFPLATKDDVRRLEAAINALRAEETEAHVLDAPEQPSGDLPPEMKP